MCVYVTELHIECQAHKETGLCKKINYCGVQILRFQESHEFTARNVCDSNSSIGSCTVYNQCTEQQFAAIYIRERMMVAEIAKVSHFTVGDHIIS